MLIGIPEQHRVGIVYIANDYNQAVRDCSVWGGAMVVVREQFDLYICIVFMSAVGFECRFEVGIPKRYTVLAIIMPKIYLFDL